MRTSANTQHRLTALAAVVLLLFGFPGLGCGPSQEGDVDAEEAMESGYGGGVEEDDGMEDMGEAMYDPMETDDAQEMEEGSQYEEEAEGGYGGGPGGDGG